MRHVGEQPDDLRQACVFPDPQRGRGTFTLVEDDGISLGYQRGEYAEVTLAVEAEPDHIALRVHPPQGHYSLPYTQVEFILPFDEARPVQVERGSDVWTDEQGRQHVAVSVEG
jgi:alpha-glucosidase